MNRTFILSLTIAVFPLVTCYGQTTTVAVVKGLVINAFTGEPLSYATVSLSKKGIETMSNESGKFTFKIPVGDIGDSILLLWHNALPANMLLRQPDKDIFIILLSNHSGFPRFDMTDLILNELN